MKLIELLTEMLILEVGEGVEPYEYKITSSGPYLYEAVFNVTSREGIVLDEIKISLKINKIDSLPIKLLCGEIKYLHISFESEKTSFRKTSKPIDKTYIEYRDEEERRQPFKIMSTVVSFVKEVLFSYEPSVEIISFSFSGGTEKEARQKEKLYRAYLSKELSKGEFDFVEPISMVKKITFAKVIKRNTNDCLSYYFNEDGTYNLSGVNLNSADLSGADLSGADLSGADLSGADLTNAYLMGADLSGANLSGADLTGADLTGADLTDTYLYGVKYNSDTKWPEGFS